MEEIAEKIIELKNADLALRDRLVQSGKLGNGYNKEMANLHNKNAKILNEIIDTIGYPTVTCKLKKPPYGQAHLVFANAQSHLCKTKRACPSPPPPEKNIIKVDAKSANYFYIC